MTSQPNEKLVLLNEEKLPSENLFQKKTVAPSSQTGKLKTLMNAEDLKLFQKSERQREKGDHKKAEKTLAKLLKKHPKDIFILVSSMSCALSLRKTQQALDFSVRALEVDPQNRLALKNRALIYLEQGDSVNAEKAFVEALKVINDDALLYNLFGFLLHNLARYDQAVPFYRQALSLDPELKQSEDAANNLANIFVLFNQEDAAAEIWEAMIAQKPENAAARASLAEMYLRLGRHMEAVRMAVSALTYDPDSIKNQSVFMLILRSIRLPNFDESIFKALHYCLAVGEINFYSVGYQWFELFLQSPEFPKLQDLYKRMDSMSQEDLDDGVIKELGNSYLTLGLRHTIANKDDYERFFSRLRYLLCLGYSNGDLKLEDLDAEIQEGVLTFLCSMSEQCFMNEYVWFENPEEKSLRESLESKINASMKEGFISQLDDKQKQDFMLELTIYACYAPLYKLDCAVDMDTELRAFEEGQPFYNMVQLQLFEPMQERKIAEGIHSLSDINDDVSQKVRAQYEENPYPRWRSVLRKDHDKKKTQLSQKLQSKNILIAGCGTGSHILMVRDENPIGRITALDLSMASLSYAKRKVTEMDLLEDIRFVHGDILNVSQLDEEFDHIESAGVLHHMEDPLKGWQELVKLLKPGGTMKIGLYSEAARRAVVEMRNIIQEKNFPHDLDGIREARQYAMNSEEGSTLRDLLVFRDFFSTSSCRDLVFHVQEHRYTVDRLKEELDILGLEFVEMYFSATSHRNAYLKMFPDDPHCRNLDHIKAFEEKTPETFRGMYQFKLIKPAE